MTAIAKASINRIWMGMAPTTRSTSSTVVRIKFGQNILGRRFAAHSSASPRPSSILFRWSSLMRMTPRRLRSCSPNTKARPTRATQAIRMAGSMGMNISSASMRSAAPPRGLWGLPRRQVHDAAGQVNQAGHCQHIHAQFPVEGKKRGNGNHIGGGTVAIQRDQQG